jgi:hypothetical protein
LLKAVIRIKSAPAGSGFQSTPIGSRWAHRQNGNKPFFCILYAKLRAFRRKRFAKPIPDIAFGAGRSIACLTSSKVGGVPGMQLDSQIKEFANYRHALSPGPLPRLHGNRRADDYRHMIRLTPIINNRGARRWLYYSAGQKRIQGRYSRLSAGEPLEPSTPSGSAGFLLEGPRSLARSPAWRSSRRLHGIIFMSGFGQPFLGGAADWIDLRKNENKKVLS